MRTGSASPVPLSPEPSTANAQGLILRFVDAYPAEAGAEKKTRKLRKAPARKTRGTKSKTSSSFSASGADDAVITLRL